MNTDEMLKRLEEKFSDMYGVKNKYLFADEIKDNEEVTE